MSLARFRANAFTLRASRINRFAIQPVSPSAGGIDRRAQRRAVREPFLGLHPEISVDSR